MPSQETVCIPVATTLPGSTRSEFITFRLTHRFTSFGSNYVVYTAGTLAGAITVNILELESENGGITFTRVYRDLQNACRKEGFRLPRPYNN